MSCTICGKTTGPGALLCRPCKSALKRARQFTVLEIPGTAPVVTMPMAALPVSDPGRGAARPRPLRKRRVRRRRGLAILGLLVVALGAALLWAGASGEGSRATFTLPRLVPVPRAAHGPDGVSNPERVADPAAARAKDKSG